MEASPLLALPRALGLPPVRDSTFPRNFPWAPRAGRVPLPPPVSALGHGDSNCAHRPRPSGEQLGLAFGELASLSPLNSKDTHDLHHARHHGSGLY